MTTRFPHLPSLVVIALGYLVGIVSYPYIPGAAMDQMRGARAQIAFSLPTTILVISSCSAVSGATTGSARATARSRPRIRRSCFA